MVYRKATFIKRLRDNLGRQIKWARINQSQGMYMPSEKNYKITTKRCLKGWHKYCHKVDGGGQRHTLGIQDLVNF